MNGSSGLVGAIGSYCNRHAGDTPSTPSGRCPTITAQGGSLRLSRTNCLVYYDLYWIARVSVRGVSSRRI